MSDKFYLLLQLILQIQDLFVDSTEKSSPSNLFTALLCHHVQQYGSRINNRVEKPCNL